VRHRWATSDGLCFECHLDKRPAIQVQITLGSGNGFEQIKIHVECLPPFTSAFVIDGDPLADGESILALVLKQLFGVGSANNPLSPGERRLMQDGEWKTPQHLVEGDISEEQWFCGVFRTFKLFINGFAFRTICDLLHIVERLEARQHALRYDNSYCFGIWPQENV
jgi:hypothetical protein